MAKSGGIVYLFGKSSQHPKLYESHANCNGVELCKQGNGHLSMLALKSPNKTFLHLYGRLHTYSLPQRSSFFCRSTETQDPQTEKRIRYSVQGEDDQSVSHEKIRRSSHGLAEACKFAYNDAKIMNERARNDIVLLSREIMRLDARARQDVAILSSEFLKLDARAREDTEKIDHDVKRRAERLHHVATILKNVAQSKLKSAADRHWSNGALEADLRRADFAAKKRATEDAFMALEFVKNIHDMMVSKMYKLKKGALGSNEMAQDITLQNNGKTLDFLLGEVSADRITAIQEAYWSIASALSEADGIDYTDPEELEFLVATLIDLDAMDGKSSVSLLAECSSSPDVNTRKALANALSAAPSMWTLGNAGMGALQRLAEDSNPVIAAAASKTMVELRRQWKMEEGDSWTFVVNNQRLEDTNSAEDDDAEIN